MIFEISSFFHMQAHKVCFSIKNAGGQRKVDAEFTPSLHITATECPLQNVDAAGKSCSEFPTLVHEGTLRQSPAAWIKYLSPQCLLQIDIILSLMFPSC